MQLSVRSKITNNNITQTITTRYKIISLDFTMRILSEENLKNLLQLILQCNALKDLRLRTDARLSAPKRLRLTNLDLKNNNRLTLESPNETVLGKCNSLTSVDLSNNKFGDTGIKYLEQLQQLSQLDSLAILNLSEIQIGPLGAESLPSVLEKLRSLVHLNLSNNNIGPLGTQKLTPALVSSQCSSLSHLNLSNNNIGPLGAESLASVLHQCRFLTLLDLSNNRIGPVGAEKLAAMIPKCNVISHLYLECNYVGKTGAKSLDRAKSHCSSLKYLFYKDYKLY
jgi:Ran GTPase-activating protein (RanGAP) involved in mRNA processing and transport